MTRTPIDTPALRPLRGRASSSTALAVLLASLALSVPFAAPAIAQSDAGTAQEMADDDAPKDPDADAAAGDAPDTAMTEGQCAALLASLEEVYATREGEANAALAEIADSEPLVLTMREGAPVDLRGADVNAGPVENWFGDPPRRKQVGDAITAIRSFNEGGDEAACVEAANAINALIGEWDGTMAEAVEAVETAAEEVAEETEAPSDTSADATADTSADATADGTGAGDDEGATPATEEASADDAPAGDAAAETDTAAGDDASPLSDAEEAEVSAAADDTGEGDDMGAAKATEQNDVTSDETVAVETTADDPPASDVPATDGDQTAPAMPMQDMETGEEATNEAATDNAVPVSEDTLTTAVESGSADADATGSESAEPRMTERQGTIIIQTPDGKVVNPDDPKVTRSKVKIETVPAE